MNLTLTYLLHSSELIDSFCDDALPVTCVKAAPDNAAKVELSAESSIVTSSVGEDPPPAAESRIKRISPS